ncbi:uncharacterized protein LOC112058398, partial [Bicyclus anynana]|uniref:Uncharacterized protein LOC112058398 n=1 Tax=Bicyclus anynana TaxID=110368 RepID=A0A6J1PAZ0_BICAN
VPEQSPQVETFETWFSRQKREVKDDSADKSNVNTTVKFFHTVDEINEDTLKTSNKTGTLEAHKVQLNKLPKISRRTNLLDHINKTAQSTLHIEYNQPQDYEHHIAENKIDSVSHIANKLDENELQKIIGNYSQSTKDKDLSKLVVNELKPGNEIIGGKNVTPISNITFTPENDTLTAMAFIAGNLLTKLWNIEKDAGDDSVETEILKHEKINNLLDLFKEPLSIRQEFFLKNALEKLSDSLSKNRGVNNVSICETVTGPDIYYNSDEISDKGNRGLAKDNETKCVQNEYSKMSNVPENQYNVTVGVVSELHNVLGLIKKFETVQENIKNMKQLKAPKQLNSNPSATDKNSPFELFGTLLDKITKLLIPNRSKVRKVTNRLQNSYQFAKKSNVNNVYETKFNISLGKMNITMKDKLLLDYLRHIDNNPQCLLRKNKQENYSPDMNIEGNILNNLSEFFKIKSFVDLMKITQSEDITTKIPELTTFTTGIPIESSSLKSLLRNNFIGETIKLKTPTDKLKMHLKAIIDDLQQLQKEHGIHNGKNISVMDAMPCIFKILNTNMYSNKNDLQNIIQIKPLDKLNSLLETLKIEFQADLPTRRNNIMPHDIPKSTKIWERMIKNINNGHINTRRNFKIDKPKTFEELKRDMDKVELMGNTYKNFAILSEIPPHKRLMLLKTLEADTKQQSIALSNIKKSVKTLNELSVNKRNDIEEFIDNVENNVRLSNKVLKSLYKIKNNINKKSEVEKIVTNRNEQAVRLPEFLNEPIKDVKYKYNNIKFSRDHILNQLIMNRVRLYLKSKEASGSDLVNDINFNIGKRIMVLIQCGNLNVAKELFKIFLANKQKEEKLSKNKDFTTAVKRSKKRNPLFFAQSEPHMRSEEPKRELGVETQDNFYKLF